MREIGVDGEEPRELGRVPEEQGGELDNGVAKAGWLEAGAEDPAFYLKPADGE